MKYTCKTCGHTVAQHCDVIAKSFHGKNGRAFLVSHVQGVILGPKEDRVLITGLHCVVDVHCSVCNTTLGWKYEEAYDDTQKYKEGKFILEASQICFPQFHV
mmetsp:Transcript_19642/g.50320  ORF Transcript_19642/g.50320 Transcript_19642/m.50320 type:complete len:102 (-) Transcript_19642:636-941(-)